jgi:hypothetical protein
MRRNDTYKFKYKEIVEVMKFCRDYHLEESKGKSGRTGSGPRGLGGEIDAFGMGKLNEIGIANSLSGIRGKKCLVDNVIYSNSEVGKIAKPDIVSVLSRTGINRPPHVHVEAKRISDSDDWLGIRRDQLTSIQRDTGNTLDKIFLIFGEVFFDDSSNAKQNDFLGSFLKKSLNHSTLDFGSFSDLKDLRGKITYALKLSDLSRHWTLFPAGGIIPRTELSVAKKVVRANGELIKGLKTLRTFRGKVSLDARLRDGKSTDYGRFQVTGHTQLLRKGETERRLLRFISPGKLESEFFGEFEMEAGATVYFNIENKLQGSQGNQHKTIDDWWISRRRLDQLIIRGKIPETAVTLGELRNII